MSDKLEWMTNLAGGYHTQEVADLNAAVIHNADGPDVPIADRRRGATTMTRVEAVFTDLERRLCLEIVKADAVVGCMAWLTNKNVLTALAAIDTVSILVQKEDFLRPDVGNWSRDKLLSLYSALPVGCRYDVGVSYSACSESVLAPVRCVGLSRRGPAVPRMHHKFMVFCRFTGEDPISGQRETESYAVWTGSFNASENGTRSLENAVIIESPVVAAAYMEEWRTLFGISEPLDWESPWVQPEYRIGT